MGLALLLRGLFVLDGEGGVDDAILRASVANTTPVQAHAAFFGVYGMFGLGLTLMCLRALQAGRGWKEGLLKFSFWAMNAGLMAMIVPSLLPVRPLQTVASVQQGYWCSRSSEFLGQGVHADAALAAHARRHAGGRVSRWLVPCLAEVVQGPGE